jgi:hypothetical protein
MKDALYCKTSTQEFVIDTRVLDPSWVKHIGKVSFGPLRCLTPTPLSIIVSVVSTWGLDLVGPFKKAKGGFIHIFVAVDKFTKCIEVKHAASIILAKAMEFIKEIIYKFGIPDNIITDNGTRFIVREFKD